MDTDPESWLKEALEQLIRERALEGGLSIFALSWRSQSSQKRVQAILKGESHQTDLYQLKRIAHSTGHLEKEIGALINEYERKKTT